MENRELREALEVYKEDTLNLIYSLEKEDYNILEVLLNKRQHTIDIINNLQYTKEEFSDIAQELKILMYQQKLSDLMVEKRNSAKEEINKVSQAKNANNSYNKRIYANSRVFNKTI